MKNFTINNQTILHFGKDVLKNLPKAANGFGNKVLLMYGKGSVIRNGYYQFVVDILRKENFTITEYSGIKPNPIVEDVEKAIETGIINKVDLIIALGGGSVIDTAKTTAVCIPENLNPWDVVKSKILPSKSLPVITILTLAATGTEMNPYAVIQNNRTNEKIGFGFPIMFPKHSFLNPEFTYSVPEDYTAYGITDIIAHAAENFFGNGSSPLADRFAASIIKEAMYYAPLVLDEPENYEYRANMLLQSTCALNGITAYGKSGGDWGVHSAGHILSLLYDMPHGATLSVAYPAWFKLQKSRIPDRLKTFAKCLKAADFCKK
ncbi:MAG: iron-containing alcohol dehydrogenase, partial [Bacteroidales bacterium]|nr:iron-containing alcohol dehydrogenase [Bacteroidales bacterium]